MTDQIETAAHIEAACKIVIAQSYNGRNAEAGKTPATIPDMIMEARLAFMAPLTPAQPEHVAKGEPYVSARKSVTHDAVTCMTCGFFGKSLKRHLRTAHGQTPEQYREHWGLAKDHAIVAPSYSATRSQLAKVHGLGRKDL